MSCDIIIPIWNQPEVTKACIDSIERNTFFPHKLVIIDNASGDETAGYLLGLKRSLGPKVKLIKNKKNIGFIKAVNDGIALSSAEFVCVLNNDTIVTEGWLKEMVKLFDIDPKIGIVNPSSNSLGQKAPDGTSLDEYARDGKKASGSFVELGSAFGFCMLMKRKLFGRIGRFDEVYGVGNFDDTDLSMRAKREGYKTVRAIASYVYHKEQSSFNNMRTFERDFRKNKKIFESRWGKTKRVIVILEEINTDSREALRDILKEHAKEKSWVYVISPHFQTKEFFEKFSNLTFYHYRHPFFYTMAFFKIAFKKKRPHIIYGDNDLFLNLLGTLKVDSGAKIKKINLS